MHRVRYRDWFTRNRVCQLVGWGTIGSIAILGVVELVLLYVV